MLWNGSKKRQRVTLGKHLSKQLALSSNVTEESNNGVQSDG